MHDEFAVPAQLTLSRQSESVGHATARVGFDEIDQDGTVDGACGRLGAVRIWHARADRVLRRKDRAGDVARRSV